MYVEFTPSVIILSSVNYQPYWVRLGRFRVNTIMTRKFDNESTNFFRFLQLPSPRAGAEDRAGAVVHGQGGAHGVLAIANHRAGT